jgi:hypothetical protein
MYLVPRTKVRISRKDFYDRFIRAGAEQHPSATREPTAELRDRYRFDLMSDNAGLFHVVDDPDSPAGVAAGARIPGMSEAGPILSWAHHLFAIAQEVDADVFFGDRRAVAVLASFSEKDPKHGWRLVVQPPAPPPSRRLSASELENLTWDELVGETPETGDA